MRLWRDTRHSIEVEADERYAAARERRLGETDIGKAVDAATDRIVAYREGIREGKKMSLLGKMQHLTESAQDFHKQTDGALDGIADKIATANKKRDEAVVKHHTYYDTIIKGVDESLEVIERLSNGPLHGDGEG